MEGLMLEVADRIHYEQLKGKSLSSVYRFSGGQWNCILRGGKLLQIRFKDGILGMTVSDTEYGLGEEIMLVGIDGDWKGDELASLGSAATNDEKMEVMLVKALSNKKQKSKPRKPRKSLSFCQIKDFMEWKCKEENSWDCFLK